MLLDIPLQKNVRVVEEACSISRKMTLKKSKPLQGLYNSNFEYTFHSGSRRLMHEVVTPRWFTRKRKLCNPCLLSYYVTWY